MKYLLLVPVRNAEHLLPFFFQSLREMNPKPDYIVWCTNNNTDKTIKLLKQFQKANSLRIIDVPSEIIQLPDFPKDFVKKYGAFEAMALVRQRLWERARELNSEWTFMCDVDEFAVSTGILGMLSDWDVDFVVARMFMGTAKDGKMYIAGRWEPDLGMYFKPVIRALIPNKLIVARPAVPAPNALDPTPLSAEGFYCFSRRLVQDRRLNWHPRLILPNVDLKEISEDCGFCYKTRKLGYKIHLDGITLVDHVIYDSKNKLKPWSKSPEGERIDVRDFEFEGSESHEA